MCLTVLPGSKIEIAQEDITCWKTVKNVHDICWKAPVMGTFHKYNRVLVACDKLKMVHAYGGIFCDFDFIDEGFHAYTNIDDAKYRVDRFPLRTLVKCTIPAGAEYCLGWDNEIVANKMIVHTPNESKELGI
jgi:hypothetical protein